MKLTKKLSIIIPTLNEKAYIAHTIDLIWQNAGDTDSIEIIVVDGGSTDGTVNLLTSQSVQVIVDGQLRGKKYASLNRGASMATGEVILFLDADSQVPLGFDTAIVDAFDKPIVVGGAFQFSFVERGFWLSIVESINRFRYWLDGRYFGDQGIFCSRIAFDKIGGYPNKSIMEAAYFCGLLRKQGKLQLLHLPLNTSARRFLLGGVHAIFWKDLWIWVQFWFGMDISRYAKKYWYENEKSH